MGGGDADDDGHGAVLGRGRGEADGSGPAVASRAIQRAWPAQKLGVKINHTLRFKKFRRNRRGNGDVMMHQLLSRMEKLLYNGPNM
eukprot:gene16771-1916_t